MPTFSALGTYSLVLQKDLLATQVASTNYRMRSFKTLITFVFRAGKQNSPTKVKCLHRSIKLAFFFSVFSAANPSLVRICASGKLCRSAERSNAFDEDGTGLSMGGGLTIVGPRLSSSACEVSFSFVVQARLLPFCKELLQRKWFVCGIAAYSQ